MKLEFAFAFFPLARARAKGHPWNEYRRRKAAAATIQLRPQPFNGLPASLPELPIQSPLCGAACPHDTICCQFVPTLKIRDGIEQGGIRIFGDAVIWHLEVASVGEEVLREVDIVAIGFGRRGKVRTQLEKTIHCIGSWRSGGLVETARIQEYKFL